MFSAGALAPPTVRRQGSEGAFGPKAANAVQRPTRSTCRHVFLHCLISADLKPATSEMQLASVASLQDEKKKEDIYPDASYDANMQEEISTLFSTTPAL